MGQWDPNGDLRRLNFEFMNSSITNAAVTSHVAVHVRNLLLDSDKIARLKETLTSKREAFTEQAFACVVKPKFLEYELN